MEPGTVGVPSVVGPVETTSSPNAGTGWDLPSQPAVSPSSTPDGQDGAGADRIVECREGGWTTGTGPVPLVTTPPTWARRGI
jgi:hypothetical protein